MPPGTPGTGWPGRAGPWGAESVARVLTADVVAVVLLTVGWYQVSGAITVAHQLSWLECGLLGLGVEGVGCGLWLYRGRRAVGAARVALLGHFAPLVTGAAARADSGPLVVVPGMVHFHREGCDLTRDRKVEHRDRVDLESGGQRPCDICRP